MSDEASSFDEVFGGHETGSGPPRSFYVISGLALAWNLVGVALYVMQVTMSEESIAALEPAHRALIEATPTWLIAVHALAVNTGAIGCLLLILRKAWAIPLLVVSLVCVVVEMGYSLTMTMAVEVYGSVQVAVSAFITAVAIYLVWYSRRTRDNGWIS